jgi:hypothetical protein
MLSIEIDEPPRSQLCECCGGTTVSVTRFVYQDGDAYAVYYAAYGAEHPEREVKIAVGMGEWGEETTPEERRAFALVLRATDSEYQVMVVDAAESPWKETEILGRMLNRDEALKHPWIKDVFHLTDHIVEDDPLIKSYLESEPPCLSEDN